MINDLKTNNLNQTEQSLLQNRTQDLSSIPIPGANLSAVVLANGTNVTTTPVQLNTTDDAGEFDQFVAVPQLQSQGSGVQLVETDILNVTGPGNGTVILVPPQGISVVSDIDDVLRITKVYVPNEGLVNSFVEPYVNVPGMPELFAHWLQRLPNVSFHYDTTTPVELTRTYVEYLFDNFPLGSLEMRPINVSQPSQILDARQDSLLRLFQTFPQRKFGACPSLCPFAFSNPTDSRSSSARRRHLLLDAALRLPPDRAAVPGPGRVHIHPQHVLDGLERQAPLQHERLQERQERDVLFLPCARGCVSSLSATAAESD